MCVCVCVMTCKLKIIILIFYRVSEILNFLCTTYSTSYLRIACARARLNFMMKIFILQSEGREKREEVYVIRKNLINGTAYLEKRYFVHECCGRFLGDFNLDLQSNLFDALCILKFLIYL